MSKKWFSILIAAALSFNIIGTALAAHNLTGQSNHQDVESTVKIIRGMYNTTNSGSYIKRGNQWFRNADSNEVIKAVVSTGDPAMDAAMKKNGYQNYSIEYYYDNYDYSQQYISYYAGPNFAFAVIDGKEYRYYFSDNNMIRRIGPDGNIINNPVTNEFLNQVYQVGCRMQNDLSVCSQRSLNQEVIVFGSNYYDMGNHLELYAHVMNDDSNRATSNVYIIDANTKISSNITSERTWRSGDNGYTWFKRHLNTDNVDGGYMSSLECFQVNTTGSHVDYIEGIYATH